jgi:hypothetical protein
MPEGLGMLHCALSCEEVLLSSKALCVSVLMFAADGQHEHMQSQVLLMLGQST